MSVQQLSFQDYVKGIERLKIEEKLSLVEFILGELKKILGNKKKRRITELEGLGAEMWRKINVEEYIRKERESWD